MQIGAGTDACRAKFLLCPMVLGFGRQCGAGEVVDKVRRDAPALLRQRCGDVFSGLRGGVVVANFGFKWALSVSVWRCV